MAGSPKIVQAPCSSCVRKTRHEMLFEITQHDDEETSSAYVLMKCGGCSTISMGHQRLWINDGDVDQAYYPSPVSRKMPKWMFPWSLGLSNQKGDSGIGGILFEVYQAVYGGQRRLAAMGIRAALEQTMIHKVGDLATFDMKLDEFQKAGYISAIQRDAMRSILDVGDAAMHRAHLPTEDELGVALDIVEGVLAPIYDHSSKAEKLADRVPPRAPRQPKKP
jgi:hypothetical protein